MENLENTSVNNIAETETPIQENLTVHESSLVRAMMEVGMFYGLNRSKTNPKNRPSIAFTKSGVEIIDVVKAIRALDEAAQEIKNEIISGGSIILVGSTPAVKSAVKGMGVKLGLPYVTERWLGGTLTNFKTISDRLQYFKKLKSDKASGGFAKYTKKEIISLDRELEKLDRFFSGIETMEKLPGLIVIFNLKNHEIAAREARKINIKSIGFLNTNADPDLVDYPIIVNDKNTKSVEFIVSYLENIIEEAKKIKETAAIASDSLPLPNIGDNG